jgi:2'-hydroxyisoflavone reductase
MRLLILGGTGFIGPHQVRYALARGHHVTIFNRGRHKEAWPDPVEELIGDRNGDLKALEVATGTSASTIRRRCRSGCAMPPAC